MQFGWCEYVRDSMVWQIEWRSFLMVCVDNLKHYSGWCNYQLRSSIELMMVVVLEQRSQSWSKIHRFAPQACLCEILKYNEDVQIVMIINVNLFLSTMRQCRLYLAPQFVVQMAAIAEFGYVVQQWWLCLWRSQCKVLLRSLSIGDG